MLKYSLFFLLLENIKIFIFDIYVYLKYANLRLFRSS